MNGRTSEERRPDVRPRALLALEDGTIFEGVGFGRAGETTGEVVFNTALCGYQEVLTDPSYAGQIVTMTYPHIGNYGVNREDVESARPQVAGFIVREASAVVSSWRASGTLGGYLDQHGIVGISEIDTRALTRHLRTHGAKRVVSALDPDRDSLVGKARGSRSMVGLDLAREVSCAKPWAFDPRAEAKSEAGHLVPVLKGTDAHRPRTGERPFRVVAYDFGLKHNILRNLAAAGCEVTVVPATTPAGEALALGPEGIVDRLPTFGICLGHQILGLACGGRTYKLKFGHRGANHPVKNLETGQVEITSQNHGFCVDPELFDKPGFVLTHKNLNDGTVEGFRLADRPVISVQYHPEASPGPHDSHYLFEEFVGMMRARREA